MMVEKNSVTKRESERKEGYAAVEKAVQLESLKKVSETWVRY